MGVCVFCVCLETFSRPQQRRDITLEYLLHLGRGRSGANLTSRIAAHRWTHTHTHPIGKEERTHTEALAKTLNLFFFLSRRPWMLRRQRDRRSRTSAPMEIPSRTDGTPTWPRTHPTGAVRARASPSLLQGNSYGHRQGASLPVRQGKCTRRAYLW